MAWTSPVTSSVTLMMVTASPQRNGLVCNVFRDSLAVSPGAWAITFPPAVAPLLALVVGSVLPVARSRRSTLVGQVRVADRESAARVGCLAGWAGREHPGPQGIGGGVGRDDAMPALDELGDHRAVRDGKEGPSGLQGRAAAHRVGDHHATPRDSHGIDSG